MSNNDSDKLLTFDSGAVMKYLDIYQSIITRMAGNSVDCKKWAVALVSAIFMIVVDKGRIEFFSVVLIPVILFGFLDTYYLSLERFFIDQQQQIVKKLKHGNFGINDLYVIKLPGIDQASQKDVLCKRRAELPPDFWNAFRSFAIWPFYGGMLVLIIFSVIVALF